MLLTFPDNFIFGTSTSAYQIESAFEHDWTGLVARDGRIFDKTTDHEKRISEDVGIISSLAPHYRFSLMWSKLQRYPYAPLDPETCRNYRHLIELLKEDRVRLMLVVHHWANPVWFTEKGGWVGKECIALWLDFAKKIALEFGNEISLWNTFNEPNLYTTFAYLVGEFPPFKKNLLLALKATRNMSAAHNQLYDYLKGLYPDRLIGISHNCASFVAQNLPGILPARLAHYWYMDLLPDFFTKSDFTGISYYARIRFDPSPLTNLYTPEKIKALGLPADDIWEYYPAGLSDHIETYWRQYGKPLIITENGICTKDDQKRIEAIKDYMKIVYAALQRNIPVIGYYHWSTWDNFEWTLGMDYPFGLYHCDPLTKHRTRKPSADIYSRLAHKKEIVV